MPLQTTSPRGKHKTNGPAAADGEAVANGGEAAAGETVTIHSPSSPSPATDLVEASRKTLETIESFTDTFSQLIIQMKGQLLQHLLLLILEMRVEARNQGDLGGHARVKLPPRNMNIGVSLRRRIGPSTMATTSGSGTIGSMLISSLP